MCKPALWLSFAATILLGQTALKFEVASIKPSACSGAVLLTVDAGRITIACTNVRDLIQMAYGNQPPALNLVRDQTSGGPAWLDSEFYAITAKAEDRATRAEMQGPMMRALLEERLKLKVHTEPRERPVYFLVSVKSGARLQTAKEPCTPIDPD